MIYDKENLADDERNDLLSRQAQELDRLKLKNFNLKLTLEKIKCVWVDSVGTEISTKTERYLEVLCIETYLLASEALDDNGG